MLENRYFTCFWCDINGESRKLEALRVGKWSDFWIISAWSLHFLQLELSGSLVAERMALMNWRSGKLLAWTNKLPGVKNILTVIISADSQNTFCIIAESSNNRTVSSFRENWVAKSQVLSLQPLPNKCLALWTNNRSQTNSPALQNIKDPLWRYRYYGPRMLLYSQLVSRLMDKKIPY